MHAHTNITSRDNTNTERGAASLHNGYPPMPTTGRTNTFNEEANLITSPSGAGSRRGGQILNTLISQNDDIPEHEEEIRSVSTLYNQTGAKKGDNKASSSGLKNIEVEEARFELDRRFVATTITQE